MCHSDQNIQCESLCNGPRWDYCQQTHPDKVDDSLHHGPFGSILVVSFVKQRAEGQVEPGVYGAIDQAIHTGVGEQVQPRAQEVGHGSNVFSEVKILLSQIMTRGNWNKLSLSV